MVRLRNAWARGRGLPPPLGKATAYREGAGKFRTSRGPQAKLARVCAHSGSRRRRSTDQCHARHCIPGTATVKVTNMWSPQRYLESGHRAGVPEETLNNALREIERFKELDPNLPAILSLNHLAKRVDIPYPRLRSAVMRYKPFRLYRHFPIRKRSGGRRIISIPNPDLMKLQRWVNKYILQHQKVHRCSYAFAPGSSIVKCASRHTGARWLIKMDISNFFGSISEIDVYRVFAAIGYRPLVSFELARLTTCLALGSSRYRFSRWHSRRQRMVISDYDNAVIGHLPQGAPTSPMLSNLVMKSHDIAINEIADKFRVTYTRYSDDITFSTRGDFSRKRSMGLVREVRSILGGAGFYLNHSKTVIVPPGSRKIVLGLGVDGSEPCLTRDFKSKLRQHLYYLRKFGPVHHRDSRDFESILGLKHHIRGLIDFSAMVHPSLARKMLDEFNGISWPL